jgi:large subunit ribosomal protein L25
MALVELTAQLRSEKGKGAAHRCRQQGLLPGILYGPGAESIKIAVESRGFDKMIREAAGGAIVIDLKLEGSKEEGLKALIKAVQRDPATSRPLHLDLLRVSMDEAVHLEVPIHLTGIAAGVKNEGGFLDHVLREVEVACLPSAVPNFIELDVTPLGVGDSLHVGDIREEGLELLTPPDRVVVSVHGKAVSEIPVTEEAEAAEAAEGEEEAAGAEEPAKEGGADAEKGK